jgi:CDP-glucose 4,6-dehydratase
MNNYWKNKNVLITGINGFIGGNLCKSLIDKGANIFGLVRNISKNTFLFYESLSDDIVIINGELVNKELMCRVISEENINVIFHLAAQVEVGVGMRNPYLTFETNIRGTYTLLEALRTHQETVEAVVVASTDKAYGSYGEDKMPYKEEYPLLPKYPYDTSKACADMIAQSYSNDLFNIPLVITRFSNIYGPGQLNFSAIIPDAIRSAIGYTKFAPRSDGEMVRDFLFVDDVTELYTIMAEKLSKDSKNISGEIFNAGTNSPIKIKDLLKKIYFSLGKQNDFEDILQLMKQNKPIGEIECQFMDFEKVNKYFGWSPSIELDEGLIRTTEWFKKYLANG